MHRLTPRSITRSTTAVALIGATAVLMSACSRHQRELSVNEVTAEGVQPPGMPERHLRNIRQLTFGGQNAESYFSHDGKRLIFQSTRAGRSCDQQYIMDVDGTHVQRVSTGQGKTTCGYFFAGNDRI